MKTSLSFSKTSITILLTYNARFSRNLSIKYSKRRVLILKLYHYLLRTISCRTVIVRSISISLLSLSTIDRKESSKLENFESKVFIYCSFVVTIARVQSISTKIPIKSFVSQSDTVKLIEPRCSPAFEI